MCGEGDDPDRKDQSSAGHETGRRDQDDRTCIKARKHCRRTLAEQECGRLDTDQQIVLAILMCVDRVIADHPKYRSGVEYERRPIETFECGWPSHQSAP